jgi:RHS repeat-associated protein
MRETDLPAGDPNHASFFVSPPQITLPKGGGAIRGIGEKFSTNAVTGTGTMSVPIFTSPGRSGFGPQLALSYDSGSGNSPFGFGWRLPLPAITRRTDDLPRYNDSDIFILSGSEDLVPLSAQDPAPRSVFGNQYFIRKYRPRVEGLFARVELWTNADPQHAQDVFWRSISRDNITTWYGRDADSRISDPSDSTHIFSWLISESYDDKGNVISYGYVAENDAGIDRAQCNERNRVRTANRYPRHIRYGNQTPYVPDLNGASTLTLPTEWHYEVFFDYGESNDLSILLSPGTPQWKRRYDSFSTYRSGFEIRTYRLCQRILMLHHFKKVPRIGDNYLVRSTNLKYLFEMDPQDATVPIFSKLVSITQTGHEGDLEPRSFPPVEFTYSNATIDPTVREVDPQSLENIPYGLDGTHYQWADLEGEGVPGILTEQGGAWFYKRNLSPINPAPNTDGARVIAKFGPERMLAKQPVPISSEVRLQLLDLAGDGDLDLVEFGGSAPGFYKQTGNSDWTSLVPFRKLPILDWNNPNLKFIDLTGDGHADILITEEQVFRWHPSLAEGGFGLENFVPQPFDEEAGPAVIFSDSTESIFLADLSGDGLTDIVRIRNGEVCYWPNLGYARFGSKVQMDNAPWFEAPDLFDGRRIRLGDIDGSGTTDIIYLSSQGVQIYFNQSGNSWSAQTVLDQFPQVNDLDAVLVLDLLGNGTACLVWSSPLPGDARRAMRYIELMACQKPHLLTNVENNLGLETQIEYAPSTKFYLLDRLAGTPWLTRLPFPVHCVERITIHDKWRDTRFTSTYAYHHGYYDGVEREFRGFGRVDQVDVEAYDKFLLANSNSPYITTDKTLYQPPVKTVTWYHTGVYIDEKTVLSHYSDEYFPKSWIDAHPTDIASLAGFSENPLPEPYLFEQNLTPDEWREALRACKGMVLRQEIYELDVAALANNLHKPLKLFSTSYHNCHIDRLQDRGTNPYSVFLVTESESVTYHYELALNPIPPGGPDPRIVHTLNLQTDHFGNILQSVSITYARLGTFSDSTFPPGGEALVNAVQAQALMVLTQTSYTGVANPVDPASFESPLPFEDADNHRLPLPWQVKTYDVTGPAHPGYYSLGELHSYQLGDQPFRNTQTVTVKTIPYQQVPDGTLQQRLIELVRTIYLDDNLSPLAVMKLGRLGLKYEDYKLALTTDLLTPIFGTKLDQQIRGSTVHDRLDNPQISGYLSGQALVDRFKPLPTAGEYWIQSGTVEYDPTAFYLPKSYTNPFGNVTRINFDSTYLLYLHSSNDALGNTTSVEEFDFRVLAPRRMKDANGNLSEVAFDRLGMPAAIALRGKGNQGDSLDSFYLSDMLLNPTASDVRAFFTTTYSEAKPRQWLDSATARYVYWFGEELNLDGSPAWSKHPPAALGILRETHVASLAAGQRSRLQIAVEYSDGLGSVLVKKAQAEPATPGGATLRWIASGKTVLNNKGKPVKQYEPYFSTTEHQFDEAEAGSEVGVTPLFYYDAPGRLIRTENPDGSYSKVEFDPWRLITWDQNDTVLDSSWYASRNPVDPAKPLPTDLMTGQLTVTADQRAAWLAARCSGTPSVTVLDTLGRNVITVAHNRVEDPTGTFVHGGKKYRDDKYLTFTKLDSEGKPLWIRDARGNLVMQYISPAKTNNDAGNDIQLPAVPCYDIAGNLVFQHSMDSGERWMINDAAGKPMVVWDKNLVTGGAQEDRLYLSECDALHRPTAQWLSINNAAAQMVESFTYRDANDHDAAALANNLQGQLVRHYDPSGLTETIRRDFKGNVEEIHRTLNALPEDSVIDWQNLAGKLSGEVFVQVTRYDALNRMTTLDNWHRQGDTHAARYVPGYNERGILLSESLTLRSGERNPATKVAVQTVLYNEKGQKISLALGSGTLTQYEYDPQTNRLRQIQTTRPGDSTGFPGRRSNLKDAAIVQQLLYTYDPVGNITEIEDQAYEPVFFKNQVIEPHSRYEYNPLYRLISASGRESAQGGDGARDAADPAVASGFPVTDQTLRTYTQTYEYDSVGNFVTMTHVVDGDTAAGWTRHYETFPDSNRLHYTWTGNNRAATEIEYKYDTHGSMLNFMNAAPGQDLDWDHRDMIANIDLKGGGRVFYQYDAGKQRTRKYLDHGIIEERIYLGGYELYRRSDAGGVVEAIESQHLFLGEERVLLADDVISTDNAGLATGPLFRYQYSNHLGSACLELRDDASVISYEEYHPYGTSAYRAGNANIEVPPKRYRYIGMERDEESGLLYCGARYYAEWFARWTSSDPGGLSADANVYRYVRSNPTGFIDPNGFNQIPKEYLELPAATRQELQQQMKQQQTNSSLPPKPSAAQPIGANRGPEISQGGPIDPKIATPEYQRQLTEEAHYSSHPLEALFHSLEEQRKGDTVAFVAKFGGPKNVPGSGGALEPANTQWGAPTYEPAYRAGEGGVGEFHPEPPSPYEAPQDEAPQDEAPQGPVSPRAPVGASPPNTPPAPALPSALAEIERNSGSKIYDKRQAIEGGIDWRSGNLPEGFVGEAYGPEGKTRFQWLAGVPEENLAMGATGNQLDLMKWYAKPDVSVDVYRYQLLIITPNTPAAMSKVAPQPGVPTLGPPKIQYFNPRGFEAHGVVFSKEWVGRLPPKNAAR